jgi:hypothetical protein
MAKWWETWALLTVVVLIVAERIEPFGVRTLHTV